MIRIKVVDMELMPPWLSRLVRLRWASVGVGHADIKAIDGADDGMLRAESMQGHADDHSDYRRQRHDQRCRFPLNVPTMTISAAGTPPG